MILLVRGRGRQKTPNEIAAQHPCWPGMTIIFVFSVASIPSFATAYAGGTMKAC